MPTQKDNVTISFHFKVTAEQAPAVEKGLANLQIGCVHAIQLDLGKK